MPGLSHERVLLRSGHGGGTLNAALKTARYWVLDAGCGCPAKASGETVHHEGCAEFQATLESIARAGTGPEPVRIVHPPIDPACEDT